MHVVLRDNGLWKLVKPRGRSENSEECEKEITALIKMDETKRDFARAYILTSVYNSCKSIIWQVRCPHHACVTMREMFQTVSEAAIDAELSKLQALTLMNKKHNVKYLYRLVELIGDLEGVGPSVTVVRQKRALLRKFLIDYNIIVEAIMVMKHTYKQAVVKLIVRKTRMQDREVSNEQALATMTKRERRKCNGCGKIGHALRDCRQKKKSEKRNGGGESRTCYKCEQAGHIASDCTTKDPEPANGAAKVTLPSAFVTVPNS